MFKAHRLLYHSSLGSRVIKKKKEVNRGSARVLTLGVRGWRLVSITPEP